MLLQVYIKDLIIFCAQTPVLEKRPWIKHICGVQQGVKNKLRFFKLNIILAKMEGWADLEN